jgi:hypothetical protein
MGRAGVGTCVAVALMLASAGCGASTPPIASEGPATQWDRIDPSPGPSGPVDVVAFGGHFVGVGGPSAWTSTDLRTWQELAFHGGDAVALTEFAGALIAVGANDGRAAIWRSDDGRAWVPLTGGALPASAPGFRASRLDAIAASADAVLGVGTEWGDAGQRPVAWVSADGRTWQRVAEPFDGSRGTDVVARDHGFLLAGAGTARVGEETRAAFWTSPDGRAWSAAAAHDTFANSEPSAIARSADGRIVAGGLGITPTGWIRPALWTSSDGTTWSPVPDAPAIGPWAIPGPTPGPGALQGTAISAVAVVAGGFLAVGDRWGVDPTLPKVDGSSQISHRLVAWRSLEGSTWDLLQDDPLFALGASSGSAFLPRQVYQFEGSTIILGVTADLGTTLWRTRTGS